eukprot:6046639-Prymnesium_polylepis.1
MEKAKVGGWWGDPCCGARCTRPDGAQGGPSAPPRTTRRERPKLPSQARQLQNMLQRAISVECGAGAPIGAGASATFSYLPSGIQQNERVILRRRTRGKSGEQAG